MSQQWVQSLGTVTNKLENVASLKSLLHGVAVERVPRIRGYSSGFKYLRLLLDVLPSSLPGYSQYSVKKSSLR